MANNSQQPPSQQPANKGTAERRGVIQVENLSRDVLMLEKPGGGLFILGDREDTDDKVPSTGRNPKLQPHPVVRLTPAEYDELGDHIHAIIADQVAQNRVRVVELAR